MSTVDNVVKEKFNEEMNKFYCSRETAVKNHGPVHAFSRYKDFFYVIICNVLCESTKTQQANEDLYTIIMVRNII